MWASAARALCERRESEVSALRALCMSTVRALCGRCVRALLERCASAVCEHRGALRECCVRVL